MLINNTTAVKIGKIKTHLTARVYNCYNVLLYCDLTKLVYVYV